MSTADFIVPPVSWDQLYEITSKLRDLVGLSHHPNFPIIEVIERVLAGGMELVEFQVWSHEEMGAAEGYTCPKGEFIALREDVYEAACAGDGRARFTAAHELGHFILHSNRPLARLPERASVKPYRLAEPQANQFAAELLMPREFMQRTDSAHDVVNRHGVSTEAAKMRLRFMQQKWR